MQIFQTFGLNPYLTIAQIINFLVLFFIFKKFLYPPLFKVMKKRQELAKESIDNAEKSKLLLEDAAKKEKEIIKDAKKSANAILEDAREQQNDILIKAQEEAKKQTERIIQEAREQITRETREAQKELSKQVSMLSVKILRESLSSVFTAKEQEELVSKLLKNIQHIAN